MPGGPLGFMRLIRVGILHVEPEVIQLQLFPFSLRDMAVTWFNSLPHESVNTWEELMRAYFSKFFTPSLGFEQRLGRTNSKNGEDKNKYTAWRDLVNTT